MGGLGGKEPVRAASIEEGRMVGITTAPGIAMSPPETWTSGRSHEPNRAEI